MSARALGACAAAVAALWLCAAPARPVAAAPAAAPGALAVVGGEPITAEYLAAAAGMEGRAAGGGDDQVLLRHLVERKLLAQAARAAYPQIVAATAPELKRERTRLLVGRYLERDVWAGLPAGPDGKPDERRRDEAAEKRARELQVKYGYLEKKPLVQVLKREVEVEALPTDTELGRFKGVTITAGDLAEEIALSSRERNHVIRSAKGMEQAWDSVRLSLLLAAAAVEAGCERDPVFQARFELLRDVVTTRELVAAVQAQAQADPKPQERQVQLVQKLLDKARRDIKVEYPGK
ncbi:MAG TPA: hypothetical protein VN317_03300 [Candidatus Methanoperedens sp.]|nr:hypothetical protein [Candidatus Methanoperedens sp.]